MTTDIQTRSTPLPAPYQMSAEQEEAAAGALVHVLGDGDLFALSNVERVGHYLRLCRSLGLNPLSRPFDWIVMRDGDGPERLVLYPNQSCAAQLRRQHHLRIEITRRANVGELHVCEATAYAPDGRVDVASKYVPLTNSRGPLRGRWLANALMSAETGAKRRVTLSMVGLSTPPDADESASWRRVVVDGTGQVLADPTAEQKYLADNPSAARVLGEPVYEDAELPAAETDGMQAATADEIERPTSDRDHPAPTFRPSSADVKRWLGAWFAAVKGTSLDTDAARHRFVEQWCSQYPEGIRTASLRFFFERCTERQAADLLAHVRALVDDEKAALLADLTNARDELDDEERPF